MHYLSFKPATMSSEGVRSMNLLGGVIQGQEALLTPTAIGVVALHPNVVPVQIREGTVVLALLNDQGTVGPIVDRRTEGGPIGAEEILPAIIAISQGILVESVPGHVSLVPIQTHAPPHLILGVAGLTGIPAVVHPLQVKV